MILMGTYNLGQAPFPEVFLHGLIYGKSYWRYNKDGSIAYLSSKESLPYDLGQIVPQDVHAKWEKMSKSKGNVIDPIEMIDIYGADALRMGLCASATQARQIDLDRRRFEEFKNFANKIWNGARFVFQHIEDLTPEEFANGIDPHALALEDRWILSLLNGTVRDVSIHLQQYSFDKAAETSYAFFWKEFCAYFVELSKPVLFGKRGSVEMRKTKQKLLVIILCASVRLMHPMAPFITEEIFALLKVKYAISASRADDPYTEETLEALSVPACIVAPYPRVIREDDINPDIEKTFSFLDAIVHAIRNIRAEMQIPPGTPTDLIIQTEARHPERTLVENNQGMIYALVRTQNMRFVETDPELPFSASALIGKLKVIVPLPEAFKEKERARLAKEKEKWIAAQNQMRTQLANEGFVTKAPAHLVDKIKADLASAEASLADVMKKLS
jgi:valyl-tRNA synthetase